LPTRLLANWLANSLACQLAFQLACLPTRLLANCQLACATPSNQTMPPRSQHSTNNMTQQGWRHQGWGV